MVSVTDEWISDLLVELGLVESSHDGLVYRCGKGLTLEEESISYMLTNYERDVRASYELVLDEIKVAILTEIEDDFLDACMDFWEGTPETYTSDISYIKDFVWRMVRVELDESSLLDTRACMNITYYGTQMIDLSIAKNLLSTDLSRLDESHALRWLVDTQGYKLTDVTKANELGESDSKFIRTLVGSMMEMEADASALQGLSEIGLSVGENALNMLTFFVSMRWGDVMDISSRELYIKLYPNTRAGFYDLHHDTVYDFQLEHGVILDPEYVCVDFDGVGGIRDVIGKPDGFYSDSYYK